MEWKGYGKKQSWPNLWLCPAICMAGLRKTMGNLRLASCFSRDVNPTLPEYNLQALSLLQISALHLASKESWMVLNIPLK
jgi:hypothetical protein